MITRHGRKMFTIGDLVMVRDIQGFDGAIRIRIGPRADCALSGSDDYSAANGPEWDHDGAQRLADVARQIADAMMLGIDSDDTTTIAERRSLFALVKQIQKRAIDQALKEDRRHQRMNAIERGES